jgi:hypothetical protein
MGILTYIKIAGIAALVIVVGYFVWTYQGMKNEVRVLKDQKAALEVSLQTAEKTVELLKEYANVDEIIDDSTDDDVLYYLQHGVFPKTHDSEGNGLSTSPKPPDTAKPNR